MLDAIIKQGPKLIFLLAGIVFIFLSLFDVQDITKLQVVYLSSIRYASLFIGVCCVAFSMAWYILPWLSVPLSYIAMNSVRKTSNGFATHVHETSIEVVYGQIQSIPDVDLNTLVALPANDLFDDKCIEDPRSALGAFVMNRFPNKVHQVSELVKQQLVKNQRNADSGKPERYETGTALFFDQPLSEKIKMAFISTTTVLEGEGIRCDAEDVIEAVKGIHQVMNMHRLGSVVVPLLGSGHGGLRVQISLMCMLIAFAECLSRQDGRHIKRVRIVIYRDNDKVPGVIKDWESRRMLAFVKKYCCN